MQGAVTPRLDNSFYRQSYTGTTMFLHSGAGDRIFPLESVKQLKELMDLDEDSVSLHLPETSVIAACANPLLPQIFRSVCRGRRTGIVFSTLVKIVSPSDPCEICANPSCFGCLN